MKIVIPIKPVPKGRPRFANGHAYTPKETRWYEETVQTIARLSIDGKEYKCKDCKWLSDIRRTYYGNECKNPEKQAKWENQKYLWMGELRSKKARYKYPSALACKKFEARDESAMDSV